MVEIKDDTAAEIINFVKKHENNANERAWRDQLEDDFDLYALICKPISKKEGDYEEMTTNKPRTFSDKLTDEMAYAHRKVSLPLYGEKKQRKEDSMTELTAIGLLRMADQNLILQAQPPTQSQMAWMVNNRGIIIPRVWLYEEDDKLFVDIAIWDGLHTYWQIGLRGLQRVVRVRWDDADSLADQYGNDKVKENADKYGNLKVYDSWGKEKEVVVVGGQTVNEMEHGRGYPPVGIFPTGNMPLIYTERHSDAMKYWAATCFARNRNIWPQESRLLSFDMTTVALSTHTPILNYFDSTNGGEPAPIDANPWRKGKTIPIDIGKGQKLDPMFLPPTSPTMAHLYSEIENMESMGSAPSILWGRQEQQTTAQGTAMLIHAGMGALKTGLTTMENAYTWIVNELIKQYKDGDFKDTELRSFDNKEKPFAVKVKANDLVTDKELIATLKVETPQDDFQNAGIASTLVDKDILSRQTVRDKYCNVSDPDSEQEIINREFADKNLGLKIMEQIEALIKDDPKGNREKVLFLKQILDQMINQMTQPQGSPPAAGVHTPVMPQADMRPPERGTQPGMMARIMGAVRGR